MSDYITKRRKFVNLRKKPKVLKSDFTLSKKLDLKAKTGFMNLLASPNTPIEQLEKYNSDWYNWLYNLFNETRTKELNKTLFLEEIPFYSSSLFRDYGDIYLALLIRENPLNSSFIKYSAKWTPKEYLIENLDSKISESINLNGAFYYVLPKEYKWFNFEIVGKDILSNIEVKLVKSRAKTLPKQLIYWGFTNDKSKPYFLGYFSEEEFEKSSKIKALDRKRLLENNLRERGFISNFIEGVLVWNISEIPVRKLKRDILVISLKEGLFKSFLLKYTNEK